MANLGKLAISAESGNVIITRDTAGLSYVVYVLERLPNGVPVNTLYLDKGEVKRQKYVEGDVRVIPYLRINFMEIDTLFSDLLDAMLILGITPKKQITTKREAAALENHLSDMRKIVSKKLNVDL